MAAEMLLMRGINRFRKVTLAGQKRVSFITPHLKEQEYDRHRNASRFSGVVECARGLDRYLGRSGHRLFGEIRPAQQHVYGQICLFHQDHRYYSGLKREGVDTTKDAKTPDSRKHKQMVQHTKL